MTDEKPTRRQYTKDEKAAAVALAHDIGLAKAARQLDIPKSTLKSWATKADVAVATPEATAKVAAATEVSVVTRQQKLAAAKETLVDKLADVALKSIEVQLKMLEAGDNRLDHVVGSGTRAIHDLQLLEGGPTEIIEELDVASMMKLRDDLEERRKKAVEE